MKPLTRINRVGAPTQEEYGAGSYTNGDVAFSDILEVMEKRRKAKEYQSDYRQSGGRNYVKKKRTEAHKIMCTKKPHV